MNQIVVDASVAVKWCLPTQQEDLVPEAEDLLASCERSEVQFVVPDLFWVELGNALWKAVRRARIGAEPAAAAYKFVGDLGIETALSFDLVPTAVTLAIRHGRTVYDSLYVALALQSGCDLITADERLANALAAHLPVKWLGAY